MKKIKIDKANWAFQLTSSILIAIAVEIGAVFIGRTIHVDRHPGLIPTTIIALVGVVIVLLGIIRVFEKKHYSAGAIAIVFGVICVAIGLSAMINTFGLYIDLPLFG